MSTNRNPVKQYSITFPQSGQVGREDLLKGFPPTSYAIVCKEEHQDGSPHLHAALKFKKGISKTQLLKWVDKNWPNDNERMDCKISNNFSDWCDYCMKHDPHHLIRGSLERKKYQKEQREFEELEKAHNREREGYLEGETLYDKTAREAAAKMWRYHYEAYWNRQSRGMKEELEAALQESELYCRRTLEMENGDRLQKKMESWVSDHPFGEAGELVDINWLQKDYGRP